MLDPTVIGPGGRKQDSRPLLRTMLGRVLRRIRQGQGRTLADVARAAKVSMPYLSEIERGRKEASSEVLAAICDSLGIALPDVLAEVGRRLVDDRLRGAPARQAGQVVQLRGIGSHRSPPQQQRGPADAQCLLAA
jgi:transcriptional regulator with XRE-family HTH domain